MEIELRDIAYIRGENKSSVSEASLAVHTPHGYDFLLEQTTADRLQIFLELPEDATITCTEMPILGAVKIVLSDTGARTGESPLGEALLNMRVDIAGDHFAKCRL